VLAGTAARETGSQLQGDSVRRFSQAAQLVSARLQLNFTDQQSGHAGVRSLSAAAERDDHLLLRPEELATKAAYTLAAKLMQLGAAEQVAVGPDQPRWREEDGNPIGLRITKAGLAALGIDGNAPLPSQPAKCGVPLTGWGGTRPWLHPR
jgi:hypothetical protein